MSPKRRSNGPSNMPRMRRPVSVWSWLLAGPMVGLIGGTFAGFIEPILRMWDLRDQMTAELGFDAVSFSMVSHTVTWTAVCTLVCLLVWPLARLGGRYRVRAQPGARACAAFVVGVAVIAVWGEAAAREFKLSVGFPDLTTAIISGLGLFMPFAWVCTQLRPTQLGRAAVAARRVVV